MAILQDSEERFRKTEEQRKRRQMRISQLAGGFFLTVLIVAGVLVVLAIIVSRPKISITENGPSRYQDEVAARLKLLLAQNVAQATADSIRATIGKDDFAILTTPTAISTKAKTEVDYNILIIRGENFREDVIMTALGLPTGVTAASESTKVPAPTEQAALRLVVGEGTTLGSYTFSLQGVAESKSHTVDATLIVSNLTATNVVVKEVRPMDEGSRWQATVTWDTDAPANAWVEYATHQTYIDNRLAYTFAAADTANTTSHILTLYYLEPDEVYHLRIRSVDVSNNSVYGQDERFATAVLEPEQ